MIQIALAVTDPPPRDGTGQAKTHWVRVMVFGKYAESLAPRIKKGTKLFVSAKYTSSSFTDRNGQQRESISFLANSVEVIEKKPQQDAWGQNLDDIPY